MGWDYYTYNMQPAFFLEEIFIFMTQEAEAEKESVGSVQGKINKTPVKGYSRG